MNILKKAVLPLGFKAGGISCGIKKSRKKDLALIYSESLATSVGMFTTNRVQAAPVKLSIRHLNDNHAQAIIINSGNANCLTGKNGIKAANSMAQAVANELNIKLKDVLVASTGIIGKPLPLDKIKRGISNLVKKINRNGIDNASMAIMTTDTKAKKLAVKTVIKGKIVTICGIAKGAGMVYPQVSLQGTMLSFIVTDIAIAKNALKQALKNAVENSFNSISIDGCMSTNDTILVLANGKAKNKKLNFADNAFCEFSQVLNYVCLELAKKIVEDAEGATKFIQINVKGAKNSRSAKQVAFAVANSNLLKTAIFGENRNLGRIFAALGQTGINICEDKIKINCSSFKKKDVKINIDLGMGKSEATVYTSDLSEEYVRINAAYN